MNENSGGQQLRLLANLRRDLQALAPGFLSLEIELAAEYSSLMSEAGDELFFLALLKSTMCAIQLHSQDLQMPWELDAPKWLSRVTKAELMQRLGCVACNGLEVDSALLAKVEMAHDLLVQNLDEGSDFPKRLSALMKASHDTIRDNSASPWWNILVKNCVHVIITAYSDFICEREIRVEAGEDDPDAAASSENGHIRLVHAPGRVEQLPDKAVTPPPQLRRIK